VGIAGEEHALSVWGQARHHFVWRS